MEEKDSYEIEFDKKTQILLDCQQNFGIDSCFKCEKILDCQIRDDYVKATFENMSKGQSGGFDF
ncbi:MAG: hypothetical protein IJ211_05135 [Campylobacter sp.]|nr:hypothetical protein [Campylobacter sp.]